MLLSVRTTRRAVAGLIGSGAMAGAMLFGAAALAFAQPTPAPPPPPAAAPAPGCTAADLAQASGTVGTAMAAYMFSHPDVNNFFTSLRGLPNEELRGRVQTYMDANPQVETEINGIRQPVTELRNRCDAPAPLEG
ncbi:MAG: heme-binding protein [Mycobacterium sp.]|jgi:hemophore-related protein|nr:heme-binding protein [Mycobacterium sp.]